MVFKRRITPEQLQELTEEQKKKLWDWWELSEGDVFIVSNTKNTIIQNYIGAFSRDSLRNFREKPKGYMPLLDIGQMVEFLKGSGKRDRLPDINHEYDTRKHYIDVGIWTKDSYLSSENCINQTECDQLCDALWMVVKAVL